WNAATDGDAWLINGLLGSSCDVQTLYFRIFDVNNNPAPAGTRLDTVDADKLAPLTISPNVVPSTADIGGTIHRVNIKPDSACGKGSFAIKMTVPSGAVFATKSFRNY
ncbi:MAG: hypothetical protein ACLGI6_11330, partial [Gammaproteobacteria bacterium]